MTDQFERDLAEVFDSTATDADVPHLPLADVVARGRSLREVRRRRATLWTAVAAAVAVVAVCVPVAVAAHHGDDQRPAPAHRTSSPSPTPPAGPPPTLAYLDHGTLHADGLTLRTGGKAILSRGGTTYVTTSTNDPWSWSHLVDGRLKPVSRTTASMNEPWLGWHGQALSPDGTLLVVVTYPTQDTTRLIAYDTADDHEIAHVDVAEPFMNWTGGGNSLTLLGIDATRRVFWVQEHTGGGKGPETDWVWQPGHSEPSQLGEPFASQPSGMFAVTPAGPLVGKAVLSEDTNGDWAAVARLSAGTVWSPSGAVYARRASSPAFVATASGTTIAARLPGALQRWIGFESETDVLGAVGTGQSAELARCDVTTGACLTIAKLPDGWKSWQWATNGPAATVPSSSPSPDGSVAGLPRGDEAGIAMISKGVLTFRGRTLAHDVGSALEAGTTILVVHPGAANTSAYTVDQVLPTGQTTSIPALGDADGRGLGPIGPVLSPDGTIAVGVDQDGSGATLTEWSLTRHRVLGTTRVPDGSPETLGLSAVDDHGRVYATTYAPRSGFTWLPGHPQEPMTGTVANLWRAGFDAVGPHGVVDPKGCLDQPVAVAPDGGHVLCAGDSPSGYVMVASNGDSVPLHLPAAPKRVIGFRTDDSVLLVVASTGSDRLVTCAAEDGVCARVMPVPSGATFARLPGAA